jgi:hypothetical protein
MTRRVIQAVAILLVASMARAEPEQPLDLVPFGYLFQAGRPAAQNAPETQWLTNGLADVAAGVMWEEHRPVREIEFSFADPAPDPSLLILEVTTNTPNAGQDNRPTWWTRAWETFPGTATRSADGRRITYRTDREEIARRLKAYPEGFTHEADPQGLLLVDKVRLRSRGTGTLPKVAPLKVVSLRAVGIAKVVPLRVEIDWDVLPAPKRGSFDGSIEVYNGRLVKIAPLPDSGVAIEGASQWRSPPVAGKRRGIDVELLYVADDAHEARFHKLPREDSFPNGTNGRMTFHPNRTVVTVKTVGGSFSFAPKDLDSGEPIYVPSLGFRVVKSGSGQLGAKVHQPTVRKRVRGMPEQSMARALDDQYTARRPAFPQPPEEPPTTISVPDDLAQSAWRLAFWHVKRRCIPENGVYQIYIWPYRALLGQESWRIFVALDSFGEHAIPKSGFLPWFKAQGQMVARGMYSSKEGALNVSGWDLNHGVGHGTMLYALAQHYLLSGDKAWLQEHAPSIKAACEWIVRERRQWVERVGPDSWSSGLIPPCELGDYADWRSLYQTNFMFWRGLKTAATALADVDAQASARYLDEAEQYRLAIARAVERSATLSPVVRVSDGTYRRYIAPQPYLRGMARAVLNPFGTGHAGANWLDSDGSAAALGLGVLGPDDPLLDETLDVVEDVAYTDNWVTRLHSQQRQPNRAETWFTMGGYYYQCGYSQTALAYLMRDDVPNFLRAMFNQYAVDIDPDKAYVFREHPNRAGDGGGGDKTFEVAAFLERFRAMLLLEDGDRLWIARGTPRAWLEQGKKIRVQNAPTQFGTLAYEIASDVEHGAIRATLDLPARSQPKETLLRLRHPKSAAIKSVAVNGKPWTDFDAGKETVRLGGLQGKVAVEVRY